MKVTTYCLYGRMSIEDGSFLGDWYFLKGRLTTSEVADKVAHYKKTWRYVEMREEKIK